MRPVAPATNLTEAYMAFDPRPLLSGDPYFVDLTEARHSHAMVNIKQTIKNCIAANQHGAVAFSGHRGSGKSTELRRLQGALATSCFTLYVDVNEFLDPADVDYTDLFLLFSRQLLEELVRNGVELPSGLLTSVENWFKTITKESEESLKLSAGVSTEVKAGFEFPFIARLLAKLTADAKVGSSQKVTSRQEFDRYFSGLLTNTNTLLSVASESLAKVSKPSQVLILIDNLDRMPPEKSEALFFAHGSQLQDLACHAVYTTSIDTYYSHKGIWSVFPNHEVLPNVKLHGRGSSSSENRRGIDALHEVIGRRIEIPRLANETVVAEAIRNSGGSVRQLIRLLREAILTAQARKEATIELSSLENAATKLRQDFERILAPGDYDLLAKVATTNLIEKDEPHMQLLSNTAILEYNGGELWHDVNPLIESINAFKTALAARSPKTRRRKRKPRVR